MSRTLARESMPNEKSTFNCLEGEDTAVINRNAQASLVGPSLGREPLDFHRCLRGYSRAPLIQAPELAAEFHVVFSLMTGSLKSYQQMLPLCLKDILIS